MTETDRGLALIGPRIAHLAGWVDARRFPSPQSVLGGLPISLCIRLVLNRFQLCWLDRRSWPGFVCSAVLLSRREGGCSKSVAVAGTDEVPISLEKKVPGAPEAEELDHFETCDVLGLMVLALSRLSLSSGFSSW